MTTIIISLNTHTENVLNICIWTLQTVQNVTALFHSNLFQNTCWKGLGLNEHDVILSLNLEKKRC